MSTLVPSRALVVDDELVIRRLYSTVLSHEGHQVETASSGEEALKLIEQHSFDVVISDLTMPQMDGIQLLRAIRERDLDVSVMIVTASPSVESAMQAVEHGAFRYLSKPIDIQALANLTSQAAARSQTNRLRRHLFEESGNLMPAIGDLMGLTVKLESALRTAWMAYQPIVQWSTRKIVAYEALVRSREPALPHPGALFDAGDRLNRVQEIGRHVRTLAPQPMGAAPEQDLFVNLHTTDLNDPLLFTATSPLAAMSSRVVLEITERASLERVKDVASRIQALRDMGFRIALDDIGAGYAGLSSFEALDPDVVKLDMSLVRDVHHSQTKQKLVASILTLCKEPDRMAIAEGVETLDELQQLVALGCDHFQGYLFARPAEAFPSVPWDRIQLPS